MYKTTTDYRLLGLIRGSLLDGFIQCSLVIQKLGAVEADSPSDLEPIGINRQNSISRSAAQVPEATSPWLLLVSVGLVLRLPRRVPSIRQSVTVLTILASLAAPIPSFVSAQAGDFNADGLYDCSDLNLLHSQILAGSSDARFDLNGSGGSIDQDDMWSWFAERERVVGDRQDGDFNFDGGVDERDGNIMGINWQQQDRSYCHGDANLDGDVDSADKGVMDVNFLVGTPWPRMGSEVTLSPVGDSLALWTSRQPTVIAETDQFQLTARPVLSPDGLLKTVVGLGTRDPSHRVVSITDVAFTGELHQASFGVPGFVERMFAVDSFRPERDGFLSRADSHMLLGARNDDVAMPIIFGLFLFEDNDESNPNVLDAQSLGATYAVFGIGSLRLPSNYGGFVLGREKQSQFVELAQLTTPARMPGEDRPGEVSLSIGALGADSDDQPMEEWARLGIETRISVPFLFAPCDYDQDGFCSVADVDQLVAAIGSEDQQFDLAPPVDLIDTQDVDAWLSWASEMSPDKTFRPGDVNLDGTVDARDLNRLGLHWQEPLDIAAWDKGDFNGDRIVDAQDLNELARNWLPGPQVALASVPEPKISLLTAMITMIWLCLLKRYHLSA